MSILLDPPALTRRATPERAVVWFTLAVLSIVGGGILLGSTLLSGRLTLFLIQAALAILLGPFFLKKLGWQGVRDLGWTSPQTRGERKADALRWFLLGWGGCLIGAGLFLGAGWFVQAPWADVSWGSWLMLEVLWAGILLTVLQETAVRGVLFRTLSDVWGSWGSAGAVSMLIAWWLTWMSHSPDPAVGPGALAADFLAAPFEGASGFRFFLFLLTSNVVLCRLVAHQHDIWAAVGLHSACGMALSLFARLAEAGESLTGMNGDSGLHFFSGLSHWFLLGPLVCWGGMEFYLRRKPSSYGRIHF